MYGNDKAGPHKERNLESDPPTYTLNIQHNMDKVGDTFD